MRAMALGLNINRAGMSNRLGLPVALVESLDQLYLQAEGLNPILRHKAIGWAMECEGCFFVRQEWPDGDMEESRRTVDGISHIAKWRELVEVLGSEQAFPIIKWAALKGPERAIEKLVRSYGGKVWRLLDVCRQNIIFRTPADLARCLACIKADPDVKVLNVKNRLETKYDARALSLGYRDVNLSVRFDTAATRRLGIHLHVCEVQLMLIDFAVLKSDKGHKRYVGFRNARGS